MGNLALKCIGIFFIKETANVECIQADKEIANFYKDLDAPPEDYLSSKSNIPNIHGYRVSEYSQIKRTTERALTNTCQINAHLRSPAI